MVRDSVSLDRMTRNLRITCAVSRVGRWVLVPVAGLLVASGCSGYHAERGFSNHHKLQVQFFAPPGAEVGVHELFGTRIEAVAPWNPDDRFEHVDGEGAVFNLCPGKTYEFKYTDADGFPGTSIYGELDVSRPQSTEAKRFVGHALVPVALPSQFHDGGGDYFHPTRGSTGAGMDQLELEHLRQGDLIRKVYFVADLQRAWETIRLIDYHVERLRSAEKVLNTELQLVDARYATYRLDALYADPVDDSLARQKDWSGESNRFIELEARRQKLENRRYLIRTQMDDLQQEKQIRTRLLDSMRIINRRGSLVLATPENQWPFHDKSEQIDEPRRYAGHQAGPGGAYRTGDIEIPPLGEVLLEVRVGGRHMHWGPPYGTVAQAAPQAERYEYRYRESTYESEPEMVAPGQEVVE